MPKLARPELKPIMVYQKEMYPALIEVDGKRHITDLVFPNSRLAKNLFKSAFIHWPAPKKMDYKESKCFSSSEPAE